MNKLFLTILVIIFLGGGVWFITTQTKSPSVTDSVATQQSASPDKTVPTESEGSPVSTQPMQVAQNSFTVIGRPFSFTPNEILVKKGDTVKIIFKNEEGLHDWGIDEFNARTPKIEAGKTAEITFTADKAGTFEYYCSVGNHRVMGMVGKLFVE